MAETTSTPRGNDPFAALGNATAARIVDTTPKPPRIAFPWVTSLIGAGCFLLGIMALAAKDFAPATALISLAMALGIVAFATNLFRRLELRLIDIEQALRDRRN